MHTQLFLIINLMTVLDPIPKMSQPPIDYNNNQQRISSTDNRGIFTPDYQDIQTSAVLESGLTSFTYDHSTFFSKNHYNHSNSFDFALNKENFEALLLNFRNFSDMAGICLLFFLF